MKNKREKLPEGKVKIVTWKFNKEGLVVCTKSIHKTSKMRVAK